MFKSTPTTSVRIRGCEKYCPKSKFIVLTVWFRNVGTSRRRIKLENSSAFAVVVFVAFSL